MTFLIGITRNKNPRDGRDVHFSARSPENLDVTRTCPLSLGQRYVSRHGGEGSKKKSASKFASLKRIL